MADVHAYDCMGPTYATGSGSPHEGLTLTLSIPVSHHMRLLARRLDGNFKGDVVTLWVEA